MQPRRPCFYPAHCGPDRVLVEHGLAVIVALNQPHAAAGSNVNGGDHLHGRPPIAISLATMARWR